MDTEVRTAVRAAGARSAVLAQRAALLGVALVLAARVTGPSHGWITAAVLAAVPLAVLVVVVIGIVAATRRDRLTVAAAVVLLVTLIITLTPRLVADAQPAVAGPHLTVAVANIKLGLADADTIVSLVRDGQVDVLVVLELTQEAIDELEAAGLTQLLGHQVLEPTGGRAGGGVYARVPVTQTSPPSPNGGEPDVLLAVPGSASVLLTTIHPVPPINARFHELWQSTLASQPSGGERDELRHGDRDGPTLLAGDLNATLDHAELRDLLRRGWRDAAAEVGAGLSFTYAGVLVGSWTPPLVIDHVLVDQNVAVLAVTTHRLPGSDHRMLIAELQLPAG